MAILYSQIEHRGRVGADEFRFGVVQKEKSPGI